MLHLLHPHHPTFPAMALPWFIAAGGLVCFAVAFSGCAIGEHKTSTPYEKSEIVQREVLVDRGAVRFSARREGTRVAVRLENVELCRDSLLVTRGEKVTTHRTWQENTEVPLWITFGSLAAATLVLASASDAHCSGDAGLCPSAGASVLALGTATGAIVVGAFLAGNYVEATDSSDEVQRSRLPGQRVHACDEIPRSGARVDAVAGRVRASAVTDADGKATLELGLPPDASRDSAVHFSLDGSPIGVVPLSEAWRSGILRM